MRLILGDARDIPLADGSVQCVVTSPPYWGLRDYGVAGQGGLEETPEEYVEWLVGVFREIRRVLADDGTVWLNLGDSYAGANYRGGGVANASKKQQSNTATTDFMAKKAPPIPAGLKPKDLVGIPWRVALALQADNWYLRSDIIWAKPNPMPESVRDRPTKSHEYLFLLTKSKKYYYDYEAVKEPAVGQNHHDLTGQAYHAPGQSPQSGSRQNGDPIEPKRNMRDVWTITPKPFKGAHFATFPPDLVIPCVKAGSAENDVVLDPFCGSGTVGVVCKDLNRQFVGIDLNPEYLEIARARINGTPIPALVDKQADERGGGGNMPGSTIGGRGVSK